METIRIERTTKQRYPAFWVGGGADGDTFQGTFVLTRELVLPRGLFIEQRGDLISKPKQALVALGPGYIIVKVSGNRPVSITDPNTTWEAVRVVEIRSKGAEATVEPVADFDLTLVPLSVLTGLGMYHNCDGTHFVRP